MLRDRDDISVIGEESNLSETIQKTAELLPDAVIIDLHMTDGADRVFSLAGPTVVAISFANHEIAKAQAEDSEPRSL